MARVEMDDASPFFLRPMRAADAEAVRTLWACRFGGAPETHRKWVDAVLAPAHSAVAPVAEATADGTLVGFSILETGDRTYARRYLGLDALDLAAPLADVNGLFHMCCVEADWERQGVGSALHKQRLALLAQQNVPRAFGVAWHRPHTVDSRPLFEKYSFTALATVERYYARTTPRHWCPDCQGPCGCTATLYTRSMSEAASDRFDIQGRGFVG